MTIHYAIDLRAVLRAHQEHERRRAYTRQWRRNRERVSWENAA